MPLLATLTVLAAVDTLVIRTNLVGYLPDAPKVAVVCAIKPAQLTSFTLVDLPGRRRFGPARAAR
ncbi:MAG: cellulase N-terminal Ig-like domain-containing protein [Longimicrobiales bacterium]